MNATLGVDVGVGSATDTGRGQVLNLGTQAGYAATGATSPAIDVTGSYTVSAWVNINTSYSDALSLQAAKTLSPPTCSPRNTLLSASVLTPGFGGRRPACWASPAIATSCSLYAPARISRRDLHALSLGKLP
ncbi:hypothetical protein AB0E27_14995 [Streptomyces sparsogenes]|uniref:hypothetical protein n=1 Tax=Streptomyces sparsogenes TaxID=67365 RepID=UPI0034022BF4